MKLVRPLFWLLIGFALSLAIAAPARAEYLPDEAFLAKMERLIALASPQNAGAFVFREVQAGEGYREGDVAYFDIATSPDASGEAFMQLEQYRLQPDGGWLVTFTKMWPNRAVRWNMRTNAELRNPIFGWDEKLDINSPEAIAASERAQQLLRDHGRPVMIGGTAI